MSGKVTVRTITYSGRTEITSERDARERAESVVETETMLLHTTMYVDGSGCVSRFTKNRGEAEWKLVTQEHFKPAPETAQV